MCWRTASGLTPRRLAASGTLAGIALVVTVLSALYVLYPHEMDFASDARRLYDALKAERENPEHVYLGLAFGLRDARTLNGSRVERLARGFAIASIALAVQIACWTWALAIL